ncbi:hypothetical protein COHA_001672 [Chlorella ohadii]|uniref:Major facilitator superfamily (MFS) profile domain-containing protein n=1 Tax=Chlorella ohadii TaxID=2649997 RepID=A0AAD5H9A8_9CHLO|nr:hypothetical protein COHA_001672 [Chlorella ohadii]
MWCHFSDPYLQLVTSTAYIASVPATFVAFWLCGWRGRILVVFLAACSYEIAAGLQAGAQNLGMLYTGRAFVGFGMAFGNQAAPVFMSEVALPKIRGALISLYQFAVVIGILFAQLTNYGTAKINGQASWRIPLGVYGGPVLLVLLAAPFLPDSPDSYIARRKLTNARRTLERLRGTQEVDAEAKFERSQLRATLRWAWRYRVHFTLCFMLGAFRALTGNPLLLFYAPELFQTLGTSQNYSLLSALTQGCAKVIGNLLAIFLVDRVGRKKLQVFGGVGQLLCQIAASLITGVLFDDTGINDSDAWALTVVLCLFEVFFEISICTLSWVLATEICPLEIRSIGAGFHVMGDLCLQIVFTQLTLTMMCKMTWGVFVFSAGFCLLFILFSLFMIPETKGVPLDQVQERLQTHWLWRHAMKELREAGEVAEAEAAAKTALAKLSGGGTEEKDAEVPAQAHGAPPA